MPKKSPSSTLSTWLTRLQAIGFGFLLLLLIELSCRFFGFGDTRPGYDPFVGFSALEPLFALNPLNNHYETRPERFPYFLKDSFFKKKSSDTFRIFVFGGSTVQGRPYAIQTAFPKWLQINLEAALPDKNFEVINCGGISYASYRLVPIIEECLAYEPDLFILCTGQNEFLEARTYGSLKQLAAQLGGPVKYIRDLGSYQALNSFYLRYVKSEPNYQTLTKPTMKLQVDAFLDYKRGLEAYHRDPEWHSGVIAHFQENFRRIQAISQKADIPLAVLNPPVNLKDSPPFKSEHGAAISEEKKEAFKDYWSLADENYQTNIREAAKYLRWAIELDPQYAMAHFSLGHCYLAICEFSKAEESFQAALVEDICPLRLLPSMREFVNQFCEQNRIPYLDLQALLKKHSDEPVIGSQILIDHVHPTIRGHQIVAQATAQLLFEKFLKDPLAEDWKSTRTNAYQVHFNTLDDLYYSRGNIRLGNLLDWTKGQTEGPPIEMHQPIDPR